MSARVEEIVRLVLALQVSELLELRGRLRDIGLEPPDASVREPRQPLPLDGSGSTSVTINYADQTFAAGWPYSPSATEWFGVDEAA